MTARLHYVHGRGGLIEEIDWVDPEAAFLPLAGRVGALWLDSSKPDHPNGRYSFIATAPYEMIEADAAAAPEAFDAVHTALAAQADIWRDLPPEIDRQLPPFRGGAAGLFGYDLGLGLDPALTSTLESTVNAKTKTKTKTRTKTKAMAIGFYATVLAFDHHAKRCFIIATGLPHKGEAARANAARQAISDWQKRLVGVPGQALPAPPPAPALAARPVSNFTADGYRQAVAEMVAHILDGDIFQANLAQRFTARLAAEDSGLDYYRRLRRAGPAPFAAFFNCGDRILASASPERFLSMADDRVETRPIKGTAPHMADAAENARMAAALAASEKNRAENVMIVDLLRNDLAKNCQLHSIDVPELCVLESYANVHHLVSTICGQARANVGPLQVLRDCFPGGSITGAPKIRAMQLIAETEKTPRGASYGAIGYIGFDGLMDTNIIIRTAVIEGAQISFHVGGGIVADSDPHEEYVETLNKARGLMQALGITAAAGDGVARPNHDAVA